MLGIWNPVPLLDFTTVGECTESTRPYLVQATTGSTYQGHPEFLSIIGI